MKAKKEAEEEEVEPMETENEVKTNGTTPNYGPIVVRHSQLAAKHPNDRTEILLDTESFQQCGKMQPFTVSISSSALLVLDLHSHMISKPVCGYLAGQWDLNSHNLAITHSFPCLTRDSKESARIESELYSQIYGRHLTLVGWYRSSPGMPALPSLKDSEAQLEYQMKLLGNQF